ncbi:MAG: DUF2791 family P-loop domain-containing protein [Caldilineaceae bacterium]
MSTKAPERKIQISTLGALQVVRAGQMVEESDWHTRQARQLLKILITERPRPVSTDRLIEILWPESTVSAAATTLRSAINALRNVLEPQRPNRAPSRYIITQTPGYAFFLHADIWLDVEAFEAALNTVQSATASEQKAHLETAIALYQDDYLAGDPYADWAQAERERLRERYFAALLQLAALLAAESQYAAAIAHCRRILARDEVRENAYQALMRYQAESGDSAGALLTYERCRHVLAEELGADPSPLTQALHQRILNGEITPAAVLERPVESQPVAVTETRPPAPEPLPQQIQMPILDQHRIEIFVGREAEVAQIERRLQEAAAGKGVLLSLAGEAGVGKTRLAYQVLKMAGDRGFTVLSAACQALEQQLPFAPLADAIGRYLYALSDGALRGLPAASLTQLAQIAPSLRDRLPELAAPSTDGLLSAEENRQRLIDGLVAFLTSLARLRPLVLFLDDLHWADAETLTVLSRLAQRIADFPLFGLLAYRIEDRADNQPLVTLLHSLHRTYPHLDLQLTRFDPQQVQIFVEQFTGLAGARSATLAEHLYAATQGNPLFVTEAMQALAEHSHDNAAPNALNLQPLNLRRNQRVQELILERMERLPPAALQVLQIGAVIGRDFSLELLEGAAAEDPIGGLEILLARNYLLERPDERLDFCHQVVRQVAYDSMSTLQRRRLHQRVGDALRPLPRAAENPDEIAFHYRHAGAQARQLYARYSVLAGEKLLAALGFRQAIEHFDDALFVLEASPTPDAELMRSALQGRGLAYESLLDPEGMANSYRQLQRWAHQHGDRPLLLTAHNRLTTMLALMGQQAESNQFLLELLELVSTDAAAARDHAVLIDLAGRRRQIYSPLTDAPESAAIWTPYTPPPPVVPNAVAQLQQALTPVHVVLPLIDYGWILRIQGQLAEAAQCLAAAIKFAEETDQQPIAYIAYHQLAVIARLRGDEAESRRYNEASIRLNQQAPAATAELVSMWPRISSAFLSLQEGELDEAERRLQRVLDTLGQRDSFRNHRHSANIGLGLVALARGELAHARQLLEPALVDAVNLYPYTHARALLGLAQIADAEKDTAACRALLQRALRFAGERSLIQEYAETVMEIARRQPADAPVPELIAQSVAMVQRAGLRAVAEELVLLSRGVEE